MILSSNINRRYAFLALHDFQVAFLGEDVSISSIHFAYKKALHNPSNHHHVESPTISRH